MPSTSDARRARWPDGDMEAQTFLRSNGFTLIPTWLWRAPERKLTEREFDAVIYLHEEWDYGGIENYRVEVHGPWINFDDPQHPKE